MCDYFYYKCSEGLRQGEIDVYHGEGEEVGWEMDVPSSRRSNKGAILSERNLVNQETLACCHWEKESEAGVRSLLVFLSILFLSPKQWEVSAVF